MTLKQDHEELKSVKRLGLSLIQLMTLIAILGVALTALLQYFFPQLA